MLICLVLPDTHLHSDALPPKDEDMAEKYQGAERQRNPFHVNRARHLGRGHEILMFCHWFHIVTSGHDVILSRRVHRVTRSPKSWSFPSSASRIYHYVSII